MIVIVGPTAVGKTNLSIEVAKQFNGEIISGDSMQVYKTMDIGTAKITPVEMQGIPHYLIDQIEPNEAYSVADFKEDVQKYIHEISERGKLPIIVGGSGLYIQGALYNYHFSDKQRDESITKRLEEQLEKHGISPLYEYLQEVDPAQAEKIHPNNHRRVIRALEIYETTGKKMSEIEATQTKESPYHIIFIGLEMERKLLYEQINHRVDLMMEAGLLAEVKRLYELGLKDCQSMKAIGYKEFIPYFEGFQELEEAIELLKRNSRRYAKRQYTWFKNKMDITWYSMNPDEKIENYNKILKDIEGILKKI